MILNLGRRLPREALKCKMDFLGDIRNSGDMILNLGRRLPREALKCKMDFLGDIRTSLPGRDSEGIPDPADSEDREASCPAIFVSS